MPDLLILLFKTKQTQPENLSDFISHTKPTEAFCLSGLMVTLPFSYYI